MKQKPLLRHLHFLGIGGSGMKPLAEIAVARGFTVSGSDQSESDNTRLLTGLGIPITIGHDYSPHLESADTVVVSSAIKNSHAELILARQRNKDIIHRSDFLKELMQDKMAICVTGTHGKTSTTAMIAFMLDRMGLKPTAAIGGELVGMNCSALINNGSFFVAECDESDGSFLKYNPYLSVVTNIDLDHLDFYRDLEGLKAGFREFINKTDPDGHCILGWDNAAIREIAQDLPFSKLAFGMRLGCDIRGLDFKSKGKQASYEAIVDKFVVRGTVNLVGIHNFQNILCCLATAHALELDLTEAVEALAAYPGVKRRFSLIDEVSDVKIYDDYAHNPGKIRSCLQGARAAFPNDRILVIFQPHRYSRLETMYNDFIGSFGDSDIVFVLPVYAAGEESERGFSPEQIAADIAKQNSVVAKAYEEDSVRECLNQKKQSTVLITIGAGDVFKYGLHWKDYLHEIQTEKARASLQSKT